MKYEGIFNSSSCIYYKDFVIRRCFIVNNNRIDTYEYESRAISNIVILVDRKLKEY